MDLTGRTILITGGSAGIGLAFATKFLSLGNTVIVTGRRQTALNELEAKYPKLHTIRCDVSQADQVRMLAEEVKTRFPAFDVLMNNAGIMLHRNLRSSAPESEELMTEVNTNIGGVIRTTSTFMDTLRKNRGTIINVSSALAFVPMASSPIYCATKAAVHSYTQSLRFQLEDSGVEVIELMPPGVATSLSSELEGNSMVSLMTVEELIKKSFAALKAGKVEIRPGQSNLLALLRRVAPDTINRKLWNATKGLVP